MNLESCAFMEILFEMSRNNSRKCWFFRIYRFMPNKKSSNFVYFHFTSKVYLYILTNFRIVNLFFFYILITNRLITNVKASPFFFSSLSFSLQMSHANRSLSLYITVLEQQEMTYWGKASCALFRVSKVR